MERQQQQQRETKSSAAPVSRMAGSHRVLVLVSHPNPRNLPALSPMSLEQQLEYCLCQLKTSLTLACPLQQMRQNEPFLMQQLDLIYKACPEPGSFACKLSWFLARWLQLKGMHPASHQGWTDAAQAMTQTTDTYLDLRLLKLDSKSAQSDQRHPQVARAVADLTGLTSQISSQALPVVWAIRLATRATTGDPVGQDHSAQCAVCQRPERLQRALITLWERQIGQIWLLSAIQCRLEYLAGLIQPGASRPAPPGLSLGSNANE